MCHKMPPSPPLSLPLPLPVHKPIVLWTLWHNNMRLIVLIFAWWKLLTNTRRHTFPHTHTEHTHTDRANSKEPINSSKWQSQVLLRQKQTLAIYDNSTSAGTVQCSLYTVHSKYSLCLSLSRNQGMQAQVHDWDAANVSWQAVGSHPGRSWGSQPSTTTDSWLTAKSSSEPERDRREEEREGAADLKYASSTH